MLPEVSMARTSSTSTSCGPVADGNVGGNIGAAAGAAAKPDSGPTKASKALAAIALNNALTFRRMIRPTLPVAFARRGYTEPASAAILARLMDDLSFLAHQAGCAGTFHGPSSGKRGRKPVLAVARAGKKRHPYHRRRRGGQGMHIHANGKPALAAIDVGTKACRLLIAVPEWHVQGGDDQASTIPRVIDSYTANVRLGESLERTGTICEAALDRTVAALKICASRLKRRNVTHVKAIATEACRRASNAQELVKRAAAEAGICLTIVTPEEEARLAAAGCLQLIGREFEGALIFDIGGGSTELILVRRDGVTTPARHDIVAWCSAPVGVVKFAERHCGRQLAAKSYAAMRF